jgi:hypothetical protein
MSVHYYPEYAALAQAMFIAKITRSVPLETPIISFVLFTVTIAK